MLFIFASLQSCSRNASLIRTTSCLDTGPCLYYSELYVALHRVSTTKSECHYTWLWHVIIIWSELWGKHEASHKQNEAVNVTAKSVQDTQIQSWLDCFHSATAMAFKWWQRSIIMGEIIHYFLPIYNEMFMIVLSNAKLPKIPSLMRTNFRFRLYSRMHSTKRYLIEPLFSSKVKQSEWIMAHAVPHQLIITCLQFMYNPQIKTK